MGKDYWKSNENRDQPINFFSKQTLQSQTSQTQLPKLVRIYQQYVVLKREPSKIFNFVIIGTPMNTIARLFRMNFYN